MVFKAGAGSVAAACAVACTALPASHLPTATITGDTAPVTTIPFELYDGRINVRAEVNGEPAWLVLDTGAGRTVLDRAWAVRVGVHLPWAPDSNYALIDTIRINSLVLHNYVVDLYSMRSVNEASGRFQGGLLGDDFLRHFTVEIDYAKQLVRLYNRATFRYEGAGIVLPFRSHDENPLLNVPLQQNGGRWTNARLLLDTGNGRLCLILMTPFVERHDFATIGPAIDGPLITGIAGPLHVAVGRIASFKLGRITVDSVPTGLGRERKSFLAFKHIDGVVGSSLFHDHRLIIDYARHRAIVDPDTGLGRDCTYDLSGLVLSARGDNYSDFRVSHVVPGSPAADAGVLPGDQIVAIDGRRTAALALPDVRHAFAVDGAAPQLQLLRGSDTLVVIVKLRRMF